MILNIVRKDVNIYSEILERGKIYDRKGQLLSTNIKSHSLFVNNKNIKNKLIISKKLSKIININSEVIYNKLKSNKNFVYLKRNITPIEHQQIIGLGEVNLKTEIETNRVYPYQNNGSHLIGYTDIDSFGRAGIEGGYNKLLESGKDIYLTIDINLQNAVRNELINTIKDYSAESGSVIIMNIKNSEVLTLQNYPDFDLNNINLSTPDQRLNRVLQSNYEMGSTFKPITVAMGIDANLINRDMEFDVSNPIKHINDWEPCDCFLSVKDIIVKSSNIGTAKIAEIIGKENQINFFKKIGFFDPVNINLKEAAMPLGQKYNWGKMETMTIGFGHAFAITPMHLAVAYASILNKGKKTEPKITMDSENLHFSQIIKEKTSLYIGSLLRSVVNETEYTGPRVKIEGYDIGGKTGTAELTNEEGKYDSNLNRTIFVGAFPMFDPTYLVLTFIDKPKRKKANDSITSATVNAPLVKNIILRMIEILNISKPHNNKILNVATSLNYKKTNVTN